MWGFVVNSQIHRETPEINAEMLLTGTFKRSVDEKLRIAIPKRFRECLTKKATKDAPTHLYVAPGTDGSLSLYTEESFARLAEQLDHNSPAGKDVRAFSRLFFARAESVDIDSQGRIRIPSELANHAAITQGEAMMIGVRDRLEIWNTEKWNQYMEANQSEYDALAEKALER